jgi:hypothetical protein
LIWCETSHPDVEEARRFAEAIHAQYPGKILAYNCSPSFNWRKNLDEATIARFQPELARMGYKFQFVTLAGFHALNLSMFELARGYKLAGMTAYSRLQEKEFSRETQYGYEAVKHQRFVGTGYFDQVQQVISGGLASTTALAGSTEADQFAEKKMLLRPRTSRCRLPTHPRQLPADAGQHRLGRRRCCCRWGRKRQQEVKQHRAGRLGNRPAFLPASRRTKRQRSAVGNLEVPGLRLAKECRLRPELTSRRTRRWPKWLHSALSRPSVASVDLCASPPGVGSSRGYAHGQVLAGSRVCPSRNGGANKHATNAAQLWQQDLYWRYWENYQYNRRMQPSKIDRCCRQAVVFIDFWRACIGDI